MKRILSVSLGASSRDKAVKLCLRGEELLLERRGTDGDLRRAAALLNEQKEQVDAFGLGGMDLYIYGGTKRYIYKEALPLLRAAGAVPLLDGSGLKNTLERRLIQELHQSGIVAFRGRRILLVCGVDRYGMSQSLQQTGGQVFYGDFAFGMHIPYLCSNYRLYTALTRVCLPIIVRLPLRFFYPQGHAQEQRCPRYGHLFDNMDIICGDFHFIRRYMPEDLKGKTIITNTVTAEDKLLLKKCGVKLLVTTTPCFEGRSFGTNVIEAALVALSGRRTPLEGAAYEDMLAYYGLCPSIERL